MKEFIRKYDDRIHGVVSCFDRSRTVKAFRNFIRNYSATAHCALAPRKS